MAGCAGDMEKHAGISDTCPACPVCRKTGLPLKTVGKCEHAFCEQCLQEHFDKKDMVDSSFTCPSCKIECSRPQGGVEIVDVAVQYQPEECEPKAMPIKESDVKLQVHVGLRRPPCDVCNSFSSSSGNLAAVVCVQCEVNICKTCRDDHKKRPATKEHDFKPFGDTPHDDLGQCREHARTMKQFCLMCNVPLCGVCVSTSSHKDHSVCSINEAFSTSIAAIEKLMSEGRKRVQECRDREMTAKSSRRAKIEWRDTVIKQVEATAEACIKMVQEQKERTLKEIKDECEPTKEDDLLKNVVKVRADIGTMVNEGMELISLEAESSVAVRVTHLKRLFDMEKRLGEALRERDARVPVITLACRQPSVFHAEENPVTIGSLKRDEFIRAEKEMDMVLPGSMKYGYTIVGARCLRGKGYAAIFHLEGATHDELLVFGLDGKHQKTTNIPLTCGTCMDVDEKDQVVILTAGRANNGMYYINVLDTSAGNSSTTTTTKEFPLPKPLSMAVSPEGRYLILSEGEGDTRIFSVVDVEGNVNPEQTSRIATVGIKGHSRITCGWNKIYTMAADGCFEYKMMDGKISYTQSIPKNANFSKMKDLSVDPFCGGAVYFISVIGVGRYRWNNESKIYVSTAIQGCESLSSYSCLHIHNHSLLVARTDKIHVYTLRG